MGLNYYSHENVCPHCRRSSRVHIGKSSPGWTFSFRDRTLPHVRSYKDWLVRLEAEPKNGGEIRDDNGAPVTLAQFKGIVELGRKAPKNHALYMKREYPTDATCRADEEGNAFTGIEFD